MIPGEVAGDGGPIEINAGRPVTVLRVENAGDRPIQVGSHYHFAEANPALSFDRDAARGQRLDVPAGTSVRFEPGIAIEVALVPFVGRRIIAGLRGAGRRTAGRAVVSSIARDRYRALYGPTTGDRIRLADTDLWIEVTEDRCVGGDEAVFGGGKVIRESMGQSTATRAEGTPDVVITGAVVLDHWGVIKADVGIRDGRIVGIGKAGNPDITDGVDPALVIGPATEIMSGNGRILTAGAVDCHVHLICPQLLDEALGAGITTIIGGGTGPAEGSKATTTTPGAWHMARMLQALDHWPLNVALLGRGNTVSHESLWEQLRGGAAGFKLHEDWGTTPAAIDACLTVADASGVQVAIHTDTLNEAGYVDSTLAAIGGRSIHSYHTEGAGGGHAPDIMTVASYANVLPSSTNPTRPHTVNTVAEHLDMLMVCHHLSPAVPEDLAFAESRIRPSTIAAEDILHDMGAISIIGSDSPGHGPHRRGRHPHVADGARDEAAAGSLPATGSPTTTGPGATSPSTRSARPWPTGCAADIGSVEVGKLADLVLWDPAFFAVRPHAVLKGGMVAWAAMGDANASIPTPQPILPRPMFGAAPGVAAAAVAGLGGAGGDRGRPARAARARPRAGAGGVDAGAGQGRPAREHRPAAHRDRARHVRRAHRRRARRGVPRHRAPDGPALLPLLVVSLARRLASLGCLAAAGAAGPSGPTLDLTSHARCGRGPKRSRSPHPSVSCIRVLVRVPPAGSTRMNPALLLLADGRLPAGGTPTRRGSRRRCGTAMSTTRRRWSATCAAGWRRRA